MRSEPASERGTPVGEVLLEREVELDMLARFLGDVGAGRGQALVLEAAAGLGKSVLLAHAVRRDVRLGWRCCEHGGISSSAGLRGVSYVRCSRLRCGGVRDLSAKGCWTVRRARRVGSSATTMGQAPGSGRTPGLRSHTGCTGWRCGSPSVSPSSWSSMMLIGGRGVAALADLPVRPHLGGGDRCARRGSFRRAGVG